MSRIDKWKEMPDGKEKYNAYLCSPEWWQRRNSAILDAGGICENCLQEDAVCVHHLTYARKYKEFPEDLMALCRNCHEQIHKPCVFKTQLLGPEKWDPKRREVLELIWTRPLLRNEIFRKEPTDWFDQKAHASSCVRVASLFRYSKQLLRNFRPRINIKDADDWRAAVYLSAGQDLKPVLRKLAESAEKTMLNSAANVENRLSAVLDWFCQEWKKSKSWWSVRHLFEELSDEEKLTEAEELRQLQALIYAERQRQGVQQNRSDDQ